MIRKLKDFNILILFIFWAVMQTALLLIFKINVGGEAISVIANAEYFVKNGSFLRSRDYLYSVEAFIIITKIKLGLGYHFVVAIHLILNFIALYCWYNFLALFYASKKLALMAGMLIVLCYPYQLFNGYLATESVYFSITSIYSCYLLQTKKTTFKRVAILILLLTLICFTRPSGLFFFAATAIYLFILSGKVLNLYLRAAIFITCTVVGLQIINYTTTSGNGYDFIIPFREEHVICGITSLPNVKEGQMSKYNSLLAFAAYIQQNGRQVLWLSLLKTKVFFLLVRTYFSLGHNLFLIFFFYPLYLLIMAGVVKYKKSYLRHSAYFFSIIFIYWLSVALSCDDWTNRFFLTLTPYLIGIALLVFKSQFVGDKL
jgi:hypothetical protein